MADVSRPNRRRLLQAGLTLASLGLFAGCGVLPPLRRPQRIGHVSAGTPAPEFRTAFRDQLRDLGYVDGEGIVIEERIADGRPELLPEMVAELTRLPVDVIVTAGTPATLAARAATDTIPIVQVSGTGDLVREGVVTSLARPGANVTGLATIGDELTAKRLDLLAQTVPGLRRVAVLGSPSSRSAMGAWQEVQGAARVAGIDLHPLEVHSADELEGLMADARQGQAQGLFLLIDPFTVAHRGRIAGLARASHLPSIFDRRELAVDGGLLSYGPDYVDMHRRGALYVDKLLKGSKAADLPMERPTTFDFAINLGTAQGLGLQIPAPVLQQATEVIS